MTDLDLQHAVGFVAVRQALWVGVTVGVACVLARDDMHPSSVYLDYVHTEPTEHSAMSHSTFQNLFTIYVSLHYTIYHTILYNTV